MPRPVTVGGPDYDQRDRAPAARLRRLAGRLARRIPYGRVVRTLGLLAAVPPLRRVLWRSRWRTLQRLLAVMDPADPVTALRRNVQTTTQGVVGALRLVTAEAEGRAGFERWFAVEGLERLHDALDRGRGAILLSSHYGCGHFILLALLKRGIELGSLHHDDLFRNLPADEAARLRVFWLDLTFPARPLLEARRWLEQGRPLHVVGDARASADIDLPFLGRMWGFPTAWAGLASRVGAPVLPVFAPVDERGRVTIRIGEPLDPGPESASEETRVAGMVARYARLLARRWAEDPGNVHIHRIDRYFSYPPSGTDHGPGHPDPAGRGRPPSSTHRELAV